MLVGEERVLVCNMVKEYFVVFYLSQLFCMLHQWVCQ